MAGFDLQRTRHRLPHVRQTLPDVQHRDVHVGHLDGAVGPQLEVVHGALVRLDVAAPEQLSGPAGGIRQRSLSLGSKRPFDKDRQLRWKRQKKPIFSFSMLKRKGGGRTQAFQQKLDCLLREAGGKVVASFAGSSLPS